MGGGAGAGAGATSGWTIGAASGAEDMLNFLGLRGRYCF